MSGNRPAKRPPQGGRSGLIKDRETGAAFRAPKVSSQTKTEPAALKWRSGKFQSPPKVVGAIVARSSSPDRPGGLLTDRALVPIGGRPSLEHIARRLSLCSKLDAFIVAVGDKEADKLIIDASVQLNLPWLAAHPHGILNRLLLAVEYFQAEHVIRINGNFPLIDPWALDRLIADHLEKKADYSSNSHYQGLIYGLGAEIISGEILKEVVECGPSVDLYSGTGLFLRRASDFNINLQPASITAPDFKASVDFSGDEKIIEAIMAESPEPNNEAVAAFFLAHPELAARGRADGASEVGLSKVLLFPEKLIALKNNVLKNIDPSYPISVELSLTNLCNQSCRWCSDKDLRYRSPDRLNLDILKRLFDDLAEGGTRGVTIEGGGEPTISPFFEEAVLAATDRSLAVGLITNGLDLFPPERDPGIYAKFEWIRVSLDAADRWQYLKTKGVDGFDQVIASLARLAECAPTKTLGVGYVLTNQNDEPDQLQHLALSLRSIGVDYLQIRPVVDHPDLSSRLPLGFLKKFENPGFNVNLAALFENEPSGNAGLPCLAHSLSAVIGADGAVWLCGRLNTEASAEPMGDLTFSDFREIWQGVKRVEQSSLAASPDWCRRNCPQCRMTKYNQLLADIDRLKTRNFI